MKQLFQNMKSGSPELVDVPSPMSKDGELIIGATKSLISKGTEKTQADFGKASLVGKALKNPDKVKLVLTKLKNEGLATTLGSVFSSLNQLMFEFLDQLLTVLRVHRHIVFLDRNFELILLF